MSNPVSERCRVLASYVVGLSVALAVVFISNAAPCAEDVIPTTEAAATDAKGSEVEKIDYTRDVKPILSDACYTCHGPDEKNRQAEMRLDRHESVLEDRGGYQVVSPGNLKDSALYQRITSEDEYERMPPPEANRKLTADEIKTLCRWIEEGAVWQEHWSFIPPQRPDQPAVKQSDWPRNAIDYFVLARLEREKLSPSPEANRETLIRRLSLDLTGLPPTLDEVDAFLADRSPDAYERVVDRLLESPRYGEHWAWPWLVSARYSDTNGYQRDATRDMWPWRDWVVQALNRNLPFDQFTVWQLAGDQLPHATDEQRLATGFHRNHMLNDEGGRIPEESRVEYVLDRTETTGTVWMGLTVGCARCHDHKFDPLTRKEYYQLFAYFNSIDETGDRDIRNVAKPVLREPSPQQRQQLGKLDKQIASVKRQMKAPVDPEKQARWEVAKREEIHSASEKIAWRVLEPITVASREAQTMTRLEDGSVFVDGENPDKDVYTVTLKADQQMTVTGLRLDAFADEKFTNHGLARSNSGNFVLTGFEVAVKRPGDGDSSDEVETPVEVAAAAADYEQGSLIAARAIDDDPATGWGILNPGQPHEDRAAVFSFAEPIILGPDAELVVRLKHESKHKYHNIGHFRLSATSDPRPAIGKNHDLPTGVLRALMTPEEKRNLSQQRRLREYYQGVDDERVAKQKELQGMEARRKEIDDQVPLVMVMMDRKVPRSTFVLNMGMYDQPDKSQPVLPSVPDVLPPLAKDAKPNRLALAEWLTDPGNPLTARVAVNRLWQQLFGVGLVKTSEDFGSQGEFPSHPELLDWLATEYIQNGWDTKALLKTIVTSATYRQSSRQTPELAARDPNNRLLARGPRFRLSSPVLRDQALMLSGLLVEKQGGPPVKPYQPPGVWSAFSLGQIHYEQDHGEALYRRSLYVFWRRSVGPTMLFDTAARQVCSVRTGRTNTPLHALTLLNDTTFVEAARKMAERVMRDGGATASDRLAYAFRLATARRPSDKEVEVLAVSLARLQKQFAERPEAAQELLKVGESPHDESLDGVEVASYSGVMSILLNLDETLTKE